MSLPAAKSASFFDFDIHENLRGQGYGQCALDLASVSGSRIETGI